MDIGSTTTSVALGSMGVTFYVNELMKLLRDEDDYRRRVDAINDLLMSRTDTTDIITAMTIVIAASEPDPRTLTNR
jgi:hypothetical protein